MNAPARVNVRCRSEKRGESGEEFGRRPVAGCGVKEPSQRVAPVILVQRNRAAPSSAFEDVIDAEIDTDREIRALPQFRWRRCHSVPKPPRIPSKWGLLCELAVVDHQNRGRTGIRAKFDRQGTAIRAVVDPRVSFRSAFPKAFRPVSHPTGEPCRQGSAASCRSSGGVPLSD